MKYCCLASLFIVVVSCLFSCKKNPYGTSTPASVTDVPEGFPAIPFPEENPFSIEKWQLGKKLFYDKVLSVDYSTSCASCHKANLAFSDDVAKSEGVAGLTGRRNAPTLANVAYHPFYTREGAVKTLEMQILVPIQEHDEFNFNIVEIAERMKLVPEYVEMSQAVFGREPDAYVITRAIATFERTLVSGNSLYDIYSRGETAVIPANVKKGAALFFSERTQCSSCHSGFNYTDYSFANNGLYETYADIGRQRFTGKAEDNALFKVPSMRNIALTAPYMHDGSVATLAQVVEHYNSGGKQHPNKDARIRPLGLSDEEKQNLLAFLQSLTDEQFVTNKNFYNETE